MHVYDSQHSVVASPPHAGMGWVATERAKVTQPARGGGSCCECVWLCCGSGDARFVTCNCWCRCAEEEQEGGEEECPHEAVQQ